MKSGLVIGRRSATLGALAGLAGCHAPPAQTAEADLRAPHQVGYMVFRSPITPQTRDFFKIALDAWATHNVPEVRIGITSPGGIVPAAEEMMAHMDGLHASRGMTFVAFNVGTVASAACYVFLAAQRRFCIPNGAFLFHAAGVRSTEAVTITTLREQEKLLEQYEQTFMGVLKARTRLSDEEARLFIRRTVILNAAEAQRDGITQGTGPFLVPEAVMPVEVRNADDTSPLPVTRLPAIPAPAAT